MALILTRKTGQSLWINRQLKIVVAKVKGQAVSLRFECSDDFSIQRTESIQNHLGVLSCPHSRQICPRCMAAINHEIGCPRCTPDRVCQACEHGFKEADQDG